MSFSTFTSVWAGIAEFIVNLFYQLTSIFYITPTSDTQGGLTVVGILAVVSVGFGIVMKIYNMVRGFIKGI